jgi:hypothetical protein
MDICKIYFLDSKLSILLLILQKIRLFLSFYNNRKIIKHIIVTIKYSILFTEN